MREACSEREAGTVTEQVSPRSSALKAVRSARESSSNGEHGTIVQACSKSETRPVKGIVMKRKNIDLGADDKYGHWWFEVDEDESYGWWPVKPVGISDTFLGTDGELNGQTTFRGSKIRDPHHGDDAEETFTPIVPQDDTRTDDEIKDCLRRFAGSYSGSWRWTFGSGQNCHTFQEEAMKHCGLQKPKE